MLSLAAGSSALAHDPGLSMATARLENSLSIHLAMARTDAERLVTLDANHDGRISGAEFQAALPRLQTVARQAFEVTAAGRELVPVKPVITLDEREGVQFEIPFQGVAAGALSIQAVVLKKFSHGHRQYFCLRGSNQVLGAEMLDASRPIFRAELEEPPPCSGRPSSLREFLGMGVEHIATGYDHLLFLLGLLLVGGTLRAALEIITSFTLAHSITLALATLDVINVPPRIIEPLIAASIVFVGVQNILRRGEKKRWLLTFCFGLIHGCGFASALRDLGIGVNGGSLVVPLLSFNLGVELGQLVLAALVLPVVWKCRSSARFVQRLVPIGSVMIALAGVYWLVQRILFGGV